MEYYQGTWHILKNKTKKKRNKGISKHYRYFKINSID